MVGPEIKELQAAVDLVREALDKAVTHGHGIEIVACESDVQEDKRALRNATCSAKKNVWAATCNGIDSSGKLYSVFRKSQGRPSVPAFLSKPGGLPCSDDCSKATAFNDAYAAVSSAPASEYDENFKREVESDLRRERESGSLRRQGWKLTAYCKRRTRTAAVMTIISKLKPRSAPARRRCGAQRVSQKDSQFLCSSPVPPFPPPSCSRPFRRNMEDSRVQPHPERKINPVSDGPETHSFAPLCR